MIVIQETVRFKMKKVVKLDVINIESANCE